MSDTARMRQRVLADIQARGLLETEIKQAERDRARAKVAWDEAQAAYARAETRLQTLYIRDAALNESVAILSRALSTVSTFPFELLSMIFAYANTDTAEELSYLDTRFVPPTAVDDNRIMLPWRLASVCRHWRAAVLSTGEAWSYIGVNYSLQSASAASIAQCRRRVAQALTRSGSAPLDVVITSFVDIFAVTPNGDEEMDLAEHEGEFCDGIFNLLQLSIGRTRTFYVNYRPPIARSGIGSVIVRDRVAELLRAPSPALLEARIDFAEDPIRSDHTLNDVRYWHGFPDKPLPPFFPNAPKLRALSLSRIPVACRRPHPGLPSLERLSITQRRLSPIHLADMMALAPQLRTLDLFVWAILQHPTASPSFEPAPCLTALKVSAYGTGQTFNLLSDGARLLPALSSLNFSKLDELSVTEALARRLTTLCISHFAKIHEYLQPLRQLRRIEHVDLIDVSVQDDVFFNAFCEPRDPMWPGLEILRLFQVDMLTVEQDGLLRLVRARNSKPSSGDPEAPNPARPLAELEIDVSSIPKRIAVQIRAILPKKKTR